MRKVLYIYVCIFFGVLFTACQSDVPLVSLGLRDVYVTPRMKALALNPALTGDAYQWTMKTQSGEDSLLSVDKDLLFYVADTGRYDLTFKIIDAENPMVHNLQVVVQMEERDYSPYISKVYEYKPAPGQFVNLLPVYEEGDTEETMRKKAENRIRGTVDEMITLGAYGGYVTFGFDHTVMNVPGKLDFKIFGNAFYAATVPNPNSPSASGSSEPGIVMVSFDENQNGLPDDKWYELAGSEHNNPKTIQNYEITYYRPVDNKIPTPDNDYKYYKDTTYIKWTSNQKDYGYVIKNSFHDQDYYPRWETQSQLTFKGTKIPDNYVQMGEEGGSSYYVQKPYAWGYVDNQPNNAYDGDKNLSSFDIDWAIDENGNKVNLRGIDFVRVYTGVNQYCGWLGETSTEISKAQDLHIYVRPTK